jgi:hypothetical protein
MRKLLPCWVASAFLCIYLFAYVEPSFSGSAEEWTPEKLVAAHVKSVGRPALLAKIQSRMFLGTSSVEFIQGMRGGQKGTSMFVSQGPKLAIVMKYGDVNYPGEYFAYDGKDVTVGLINPGQRSPIGDFVFRFTKLVKGGFLGGALTSSWPLLDIKNKNVAMKYRKAKVEGRELHELEYHPRSGFGDLRILMYFDMTTFRHVRTEYKVHSYNDSSIKGESPDGVSPDVQMNDPDLPITTGIGQNPQDSYFSLVEKFEDYKREGGLMLPHQYILEYSDEGAGRQTFIGHWFVNIEKWAFNAPNLDQKLFRAHK